MTAGQAQLTRLLEAWGQGDSEALDQLTPFIYTELRKLAQFHMSREAAGHTLQPTALINEAFLKLIDIQQTDWKSRKHFYAAASQIMRRLLVDYARKKRSIKRGRELKRVPFEEAIAQAAHLSGAFDIVARTAHAAGAAGRALRRHARPAALRRRTRGDRRQSGLAV